MAGVKSLLGDSESSVEKFLELSKGKTGKEKRELEQRLLKPEKIKKYTGTKVPKTSKEPLLKSTVKFVFTKKEELELMKRTLPVSKHVEMSVSNHGLLIALLREVDEGRITYDKKTQKVTVVKGKGKDNRGGGNKRTLQSWRMSK